MPHLCHDVRADSRERRVYKSEINWIRESVYGEHCLVGEHDTKSSDHIEQNI